MDREGFEWGIKGLVLTLFILSTVIVLAQSEVWAHLGVYEGSSRGSKIVGYRLISRLLGDAQRIDL